MTEFNKDSRTKNVLKASSVGIFSSVINSLMGFVYRTIFLHILSANYLGISGLFTNILQILSFADLGISTAITFRFYEPISRNDVNKVGQLMNYFKHVYRIISFVILAIGMAVYPFLNFFIKDVNEVPTDVNIHFVYILYLIQTLSSYIFVYKQTILSADQRQYILSACQTGMAMVKYVLQILVLVLYKNYTLSLCIDIFSTLLMNLGLSMVVEHKYKSVFKVKEKLPHDERKQILEETKATMCHKIGGTVLNGTDNIVLSSFVGLVAVGLYSNYSLIISGMNIVLKQVLGSFTSTLGNAHVEQTIEDRYISYRRLLFANFWIASVCTICVYVLIDDFIYAWIGDNMLLDKLTLTILCIQFYIETVRLISTSYTNGCGLFVRDKIRPLIEASINLIVSIICVLQIGIAGVFVGTIVSHLCTVFWREPYLLFKYEFRRSSKEYWRYFVQFSASTVVIAVIMEHCLGNIIAVNDSIMRCGIKSIILFVSTNIIYMILSIRNKDFKFYFNMIWRNIVSDE